MLGHKVPKLEGFKNIHMLTGRLTRELGIGRTTLNGHRGHEKTMERN